MAVYAQTIELASQHNGYSLSSLLGLGMFDAKTALYVRITGSTGQAWFVPASGSYSQTSGVPDEHGGSADIDMPFGAPLLQLDQVFVGSSVNNKKLTVFAATGTL